LYIDVPDIDGVLLATIVDVTVAVAIVVGVVDVAAVVDADVGSDVSIVGGGIGPAVVVAVTVTVMEESVMMVAGVLYFHLFLLHECQPHCCCLAVGESCPVPPSHPHAHWFDDHLRM
jgi:hypothetical protein